jgi:hypothetical protein
MKRSGRLFFKNVYEISHSGSFGAFTVSGYEKYEEVKK